MAAFWRAGRRRIRFPAPPLFPSQYWAEVFDISSSQPLAQGQNLVSPSQVFELGFFTPNSSANKYVGLWHKSVFPHKVLWVANKENPLAVNDTLARLRIASNGNLELIDGGKNSVWSTNISAPSNSSSAVLLDTGNFVLRDDAGADLWESFSYPCDTLLPSQLLGYDSKSGKRQFLTSWKSESDPSTGKYIVGLAPQMPSQVFIWINGSTPHWRSGPWDRSKFIGVPSMDDRYQSGFSLDDNVIKGSKYFSYSFFDYTISYFSISSEGIADLMLSENGKNWFLNWKTPYNPCDNYGACGPFGICKASESHICKCLKGYVPESDEEWSKGNWTGGSVRQTNCFVTVRQARCLVWSKDLIDMQQFSSGGEDLYIRLAHAELDEGKPIKLIASRIAVCSVSIVVAIVFGRHRLGAANRKESGDIKTTRHYFGSINTFQSSRDALREYIGKHDLSELLIYDFETILVATKNFCITNKLGQGGFGPVYKGMLEEGKEIAVKRLSSSSGQGIDEFKNEMLLISNLQHKNLVRIMGCCIKEDEKLLIYEFMPNKSLDTFLFDPTRRAVLDWASRFNIIQGVARGLVYLHHDSYLKVIHRDLKVSNILLDEKMNPKISDFGLARIVEGTQNLENTLKVVGTRGYMSPEYAMGGIFSEKSDVYSFGVLMLEIISGKKNASFCLYDQQLGFLAYAWNLWNEGRGLELLDEVLGDSYASSEVMKCVNIGLLCVQDSAADRPTMADIVLMLSSDTDGPEPKLPVFTIQNSFSSPQPQYPNTFCSNDATITVIEGR
ncbi:hypothetical protein ACLB2K_024253 [Fragaria x ananassa]